MTECCIRENMLINPIFDRLETTMTSENTEGDVQLLLSKFTKDGTDFISFIGIGFNHVAIDVLNGDSDLITQFNYNDCSEESITFKVAGKNSPCQKKIVPEMLSKISKHFSDICSSKFFFT